MKTCTRCGERKHSSEFHNKKMSVDGLNSRCKVCVSDVFKLKHPRIGRGKASDEKRGAKYSEFMVLGYAFSVVSGDKGPGPKTIGRYLCAVCSCGNLCIVKKGALVYGKINSCGCKRRSLALGPDNSGWKGSKEVSGQYLSALRGGARSRNLEFSIDCGYLQELLDKQEHTCALTGLTIHVARATHQRGTASVDRIDSSIGYVRGNVRWVHKAVNAAKMDMSDADFIRMCKLVALKHRTAEEVGF